MNELDLQQKMKRKKLTPGYSAQARRQNEAQDRLHSGIRTGVRVDDLQGFLGQGATVNGRSFHVTPLFESAIAGRLDCIKMLVEAGAEIDAIGRLHRSGTWSKGSWTALHVAACYGKLSVVCLLLELGADNSKIDSQGRTAVDVALGCGQDEVAFAITDYESVVYWARNYKHGNTRVLNSDVARVIAGFVYPGADLFVQRKEPRAFRTQRNPKRHREEQE